MGFLDAYSLYDITSSANKMPGSYTTYLESYEMPYIYISPEGTLADLLTAAHEFGHFVDGYVNCNQTFSIDCSEVFSQALEYLTLGSTSLGFARAAELRQYKLYDSLETCSTSFLPTWCTNSPSPSLFRMLRWICSRCLHCHKISSLSIKRRRPLLKLHIIYSQFITRNLVFQEGVFICGITNLTVKSLFLGRPVKVRLLTALRKKSGECLWQI